MRIGGATARKYEADLWIHGVHGPYPLDMKGGIIVYPNDDNPARLPILGLRAIVQNELTLTVDGKGRMVVLKAPGWPWF